MGEYRASERAQSRLNLSATGSRQLSEVTLLEMMNTQQLSWKPRWTLFFLGLGIKTCIDVFMFCLEERHERHERRQEKHKRHERVQSERDSTEKTKAKSTPHTTKRASQYQKEKGTILLLFYTQGGIELLHTREQTARNCA